MQPAPIQISYMGFPGTTGASYIHYLITDEVGYFSIFYSNSELILYVKFNTGFYLCSLCHLLVFLISILKSLSTFLIVIL